MCETLAKPKSTSSRKSAKIFGKVGVPFMKTNFLLKIFVLEGKRHQLKWYSVECKPPPG